MIVRTQWLIAFLWLTSYSIFGVASLRSAEASTQSNICIGAESCFNSAPEPAHCTSGERCYYVDFAEGIDSNNGLSPRMPFKHSPGDVNARAAAASVKLQPGDRVVFKGGVHYRGTVVVSASGVAGKAIIFDGNVSGTFGSGQAIIDGSEILSGWAKCDGNYASLYCATLPADIVGDDLNLYQGDRKALVAQSPQPSDYYRRDNIDEYFTVASTNVGAEFISDPRNLATFDLSWQGARALIWGVPNSVRERKLRPNSGDSNTIRFDAVRMYADRDTRYAIINHISSLDSPGEYVVDRANKRVYYKPLDGIEIENSITISKRPIGILVNGSYVAVRGFVLQKHVGYEGDRRSGVGIRVGQVGAAQLEGIRVEANEVRFNSSREGVGAVFATNVRNGVIAWNNVHHNVPNRGILVTGSKNVTAIGNSVTHVGGTGIAYFGVQDGRIVNNTVQDSAGTHANGVSVYLGSDRTVVCRNKVVRGNIALTTKESADVSIAFNILDSVGDGYTVADWGGSRNLTIHNNIIFNKAPKALYISKQSVEGLRVANNVLDGASLSGGTVDVTHNVYTKLMWNQKAKYGWSLGEGEAVADKSDLFVDIVRGDFTPSAKGKQVLRVGRSLTTPECYDGPSSFIGMAPL